MSNKKFFILPYKGGSRSARALAAALDGKVLRVTGSSYVPRQNHVVINWGRSNGDHTAVSPQTPATVINLPAFVGLASNKLTFFRSIPDTRLIPDFWEDANDIPEDAYPVVCRTVLSGHSGQGIVIANSPEELVPAPLYVKYVKKKHEFRVHTGHGKIIVVQRKAKRQGAQEVDWRIRSHSNGFVFVRQGFEIPDQVLEVASAVLEELGLDFGAVDVIWNEHEQRAYALEVNTAPGLEGQTIEDYANFFKELVGSA